MAPEPTQEELAAFTAEAERLLDEILGPAVKRNARPAEIMLLIESLAVGVILFCLKAGIDRSAIALFTHNVARRLNDAALRDYLEKAPPEGHA